MHVIRGILAPSHVLKAIGVNDDLATSSVRFTLGYENTLSEIEMISKTLETIVEKLRKNKKRDKIKCECNK